MPDKPKDNLCGPMFFCYHGKKECVYFSGKEEHCKHMNQRYECNSKVAQVNAMVLKLKEIGFEVSRAKGV